MEFLLERTKDRRVNDPSDGDKGARTGESFGRARAGAGAGRRRSVNVNRPPPLRQRLYPSAHSPYWSWLSILFLCRR